MYFSTYSIYFPKKVVVRRCDMTKCTVRKVKGKSVMNFCNYCKRPLQNSYFQLLFRHHFANDIYFNIKKQVISSHVIFRQTAHSYFLEELLPCSNCVPFLSSLCSKKKISPFQKTRVHVIAVPVGNLFDTVGSPEDFSGTPAVPVRYSLSQRRAARTGFVGISPRRLFVVYTQPDVSHHQY